MATTYRDATEAAAIAEMFIAEHNALLQHAFGKDSSGVFPAFCVVVTDTDWAAHRKTRGALIDTLLCSMDRQSNADTGKDRWAIAKPDVSLYLAVVKRHGLSTTEELQAGRLIRDLPEQLALDMAQDDDSDDSEDAMAEDDQDHPGFRVVAEGPIQGVTYGLERDDGSWQDTAPPELNDQAVREIRGSVEAAVK